ncbi:pentatricopeptide repeat-containing protein At1g71460, chloroplastic-like [Zingiber officinale]|uniref:Pentatricopeptide repeat-containing protein n=1 Tax=Zingiber officinale TaxID=94328 RepID=A0A8J5I884_ZINOF|nr:pentatricopeptide repeat-containing protein At1g71460, chloroplastic-like [Zingiber officinale]KAG6539316.1 hypothetical protein ZIOFF_004481 [Zingiber officinale]
MDCKHLHSVTVVYPKPKTIGNRSSIPPPFTFHSKPLSCFSVQSSRIPKFREADAFPDSLPLHSKNPHAICKDIQRLARLGQLHKALAILDYLQHRGIPVNITTFAALLSACSRHKALAFGRQVHVHLRTHGLEGNEFLLGKLVQMYATCGSPDDARRLFSELSPRTAYTWNALLKGNVVRGGKRWGDASLSLFSEMRELGVDTNEYTFSCLIKSFAGSPSFTQGAKIHGLLIKNGFYTSSLLQTSLIDMYFKCGKIQMAMKVFDEITERDIVLWGAVIAGFAHKRLYRESIKYLKLMGSEGIQPNSVILTSTLPVIGDLSERYLGREVHGFVLKRSRYYHNMVFVLAGLINMYCKCGDMVSARRVFYGSHEQNAVSWTALISGYASCGRFEQALRSIAWMQQEGIKPDIVTIATAIPVCAKMKASKPGKEMHAFTVKHCFLPNISISTSLMTMYSALGNIDYSCRLFNKMPNRNVLAWTALIDTYSKNGSPCDALSVFRSMLQTKQRPDGVALARILSICGEIGSIKVGTEVHAQVLKMKLESVPIVMAEVVKMYGKFRNVDNARMVYDGIDNKGSLTCTAIIEAYGFNSQYEEAIHIFDSMLSNGLVPNHYMFVVALRICEKAGFVDSALRIFNMMIQEYDIKASEQNYEWIINHLIRDGRINEE